MPRMVFDFGKASVTPVELALVLIGSDYDVFCSYFAGKILVGVRYESFDLDGVIHYKRMHLELFPVGSNVRSATIDSIYPVLPVVPDSDRDPRKSLYSSYKKVVPADSDPCIQSFRDNKFATIIKQAAQPGQPETAKNYEIYSIDPNANIVFGEGVTPPTGDAAKFKNWILGNPIDATHQAAFQYRAAVYDSQVGNTCQVTTPIDEYFDSRTSLNVPENRRAQAKILAALPLKG